MGEAKRRVEAIASGAEKACGNCRWWLQAKGTPLGLCRRLPPVVLWVGAFRQHPITGQQMPVVDSFHPQTPADTFCGEHAQRIGLNLEAIDFGKLDLAEPVEQERPRADA